MNDLTRLPLGILTGVGFIGGGAIIRRDDIVVGVTTAATFWYATVIGLCFGGGQIALGIAATGLGVATLWLLQWLEASLRREWRPTLCVGCQGNGFSEPAIRDRLETAGLRVTGTRLSFFGSGARRELAFDILDFSLPYESMMPPVCQSLANEPGVIKLEWKR